MGYMTNGNNSTMTDVFVRLSYTAKNMVGSRSSYYTECYLNDLVLITGSSILVKQRIINQTSKKEQATVMLVISAALFSKSTMTHPRTAPTLCNSRVENAPILCPFCLHSGCSNIVTVI